MKHRQRQRQQQQQQQRSEQKAHATHGINESNNCVHSSDHYAESCTRFPMCVATASIFLESIAGQREIFTVYLSTHTHTQWTVSLLTKTDCSRITHMATFIPKCLFCEPFYQTGTLLKSMHWYSKWYAFVPPLAQSFAWLLACFLV